MVELWLRNYTLTKIIDVCGVEVKDKTLAYSGSYKTDLAKIECNKNLNTKIDRIISHNTNGEFFIKKVNDPENENEKIKLGKILQQISKVDLKPEQIEEYVSAWKKAYTIDSSVVEVSENLYDIYNMNGVGGSCMAHHGDWMSIYEHFGCKIAYIIHDHSLVARAILWHDINYFDSTEDEPDILRSNFIDRIFFEKEEYKLTLQKWAQENNYKNFKNLDKITYYTEDKPLKKFEEGVPYIDTLYNIGVKGNDIIFLTNDSSLQADWWDTCRSTCGASEDREFGTDEDLVYAEDLGDMISRDYAVYIEAGDYYVSEDYDELAYIEEWGIYVDLENENDVVWAEDVDRYIPMEDAFYVEDMDYYVKDNSELYYCEDDDCCYEELDTICYTEDDETYRHKDNCHLVAETDEWYYDEDNFIERLKELNDEKL